MHAPGRGEAVDGSLEVRGLEIGQGEPARPRAVGVVPHGELSLGAGGPFAVGDCGILGRIGRLVGDQRARGTIGRGLEFARGEPGRGVDEMTFSTVAIGRRTRRWQAVETRVDDASLPFGQLTRREGRAARRRRGSRLGRAHDLVPGGAIVTGGPAQQVGGIRGATEPRNATFVDDARSKAPVRADTARHRGEPRTEIDQHGGIEVVVGAGVDRVERGLDGSHGRGRMRGSFGRSSALHRHGWLGQNSNHDLTPLPSRLALTRARSSNSLSNIRSIGKGDPRTFWKLFAGRYGGQMLVNRLPGLALDLSRDLATVVPRTLQLLDAAERLLDRADGLVTDIDATRRNADEVIHRTEAVVTDAQELIARTSTVVTDADEIIARTSTVVGDADEIIGRTSRVVTDANALIVRTAGTVASAEPTVRRADELVSALTPPVERLLPTLERLAESTHPEEVEALINLIDHLPMLVGKLEVDIVPILENMRSVGPDIHALLDTVQDLAGMLAKIPGLGRRLKNDD